jgi:hypothetical protein
MSKDTELKTGALHLRLMDDEEQYSKFLAHLIYYNKDNESYTQDVLTALENGLKNFKRYQKLDNALSTRLIKIEKRVFGNGEKLAANDTEGAYQVLFHFDDDTEEVIHFGRKRSKLLFLLILFSHDSAQIEYYYEKHIECSYETIPASRYIILFTEINTHNYHKEYE